MQTALTLSVQDRIRQETLEAHTQAVEQAIQVMHMHFREPLSLGDLAASAYLSPYHFHRIFSRMIGVPPGDFLSALRFQAARQLLVTTNLRVTDICYEVGYTSPGSFTSRFTRLVGLSPRSLRQRAQAFEPTIVEFQEEEPQLAYQRPLRHALSGHISVPATFKGTIYLGLFHTPVPQGMPVRCLQLFSSATYTFPALPDGIYYLRAAAFPLASNLAEALVPGKRMLLGSSKGPIVVRHGEVLGSGDLTLRAPRLIDPPLVMGLPLL